MNLQEQVEAFVLAWAPVDERRGRTAFIEHLRRLLNAYAEAAIQHGNLPEVGKPHGGLKQL